jgi:hypothetical protein
MLLFPLSVEINLLLSIKFFELASAGMPWLSLMLFFLTLALVVFMMGAAQGDGPESPVVHGVRTEANQSSNQFHSHS